MKNSSSLAGLLFSLLVSQALSAELEQCSTSEEAYYREVDRRIDDAVGSHATLSITTLPSFEEESGVRLFRDGVYFVQFHESLWAKEALEPAPAGSSALEIRVTVSHAFLNRDLVHEIKVIFAEAVARAAKSGRMVVDGTTFRVSANSACGQARSPQPESMAARLVELVKLLQDHAQSDPRDVRRSEQAIAGLLATIRSR